MSRPSIVTSDDVALLRSIGRERSLVVASRRAGISRDRAVYRIRRLARAFGGPVVVGVRGGADHGGTVLTPLGDRIARGGFDSIQLLGGRPATPAEQPNLWRGIYRRGRAPEVRIGRTLRVRVAFDADDGAAVAVLLDPDAIVVARSRFASSARNVLGGTVAAVRPGRGGFARTLVVRCSGVPVRVTVTPETVQQFGLRPGVRVWLYIKATALRRVGPD